jgi:cytochrome c2
MKRALSLAIAVVTLAAFGSIAKAEGDPEAGQKVFRKCAQCHDVGADAKNKIGPILTNIYGAKPASVEGFDYSPALKEAAEEGWVWDEEHLDKYLENPKTSIPGNKMLFVGLKKPADRENIIAYLKSVHE